MKKYYRLIDEVRVNICIEDGIYNQEKDVFDCIFKSYSTCDSSKMSFRKEFYYHIQSSENLLENRLHYGMVCDVNSEQWIFLLISDLENFYLEILNCTVIHGSCVRINGKNILIIGERWSGKTTLTYFLTIENEGEYLSDDCIYIFNDKYIGLGMPLPMRDITNTDSKYIIARTVDEEQQRRILFQPPRVIKSLSNIEMVIFPKYNPNAKNDIKKISCKEAFDNIILNVRAHCQVKSMFKDIIRLATKSDNYIIDYSDSPSAYYMLFGNHPDGCRR